MRRPLLRFLPQGGLLTDEEWAQRHRVVIGLLSGYYGGIWLRGELVASGHNSLLASVSLPPTEEQFTTDVGRCESILEAAAGRDVGLLKSRGYRPIESIVVDLFPHTHHTEVVTRFDRVS